ncbi:MAG: hypothetical protein ACR2RB_22240 [Gammaproteobacteria bacterium]
MHQWARLVLRICWGLAGDAVGDVDGRGRGLFVDALSLDDEGLGDMREIEIVAELIADPDFTRFDAAMLRGGVFDVVGGVAIAEQQGDVVARSKFFEQRIRHHVTVKRVVADTIRLALLRDCWVITAGNDDSTLSRLPTRAVQPPPVSTAANSIGCFISLNFPKPAMPG